MCYHILNLYGKVISRSSVQRVTQLELQTIEYKGMFEDFDKLFKDKLKCKDRGCDGDKPNPDDWAVLIEINSNFNEEFNRIYNNQNISGADNSTPGVLEDTYLNMKLAMPRGIDGPEFDKVTKRPRDADSLPIGTENDNPLLDIRIYEVEYPDGYKVALTANTIT